MTKTQELVLLQTLNTLAILCSAIAEMDEPSSIRQPLREQSETCVAMVREHYQQMKDLE